MKTNYEYYLALKEDVKTCIDLLMEADNNNPYIDVYSLEDVPESRHTLEDFFIVKVHPEDLEQEWKEAGLKVVNWMNFSIVATRF